MSYDQLRLRATYFNAREVPTPTDGVVCLRVIDRGEVALYVFKTVNEVAEAAFMILTSDESVTADAIFNGRKMLWKNDGLAAQSRLLRLM